MDKSNIVYVILIFLFLKYGIKELSIIYLIIISVGILYFGKKYMKESKTTTSIKLDEEVDSILKNIEKYDNNNLLLKVRKNYNNLNKYLKKSNKTVRDKGDIDFLKGKILDYINSLNISYDDPIIDTVYNSISKLIDSKS
tara:strand:- start:727 stop:1146 length:420 start_codon:yes stop_codon:yes gene_type:complete